MSKREGQKLKLLYIERMLHEYSDESHPLSTQSIIEKLSEKGIKAERKAIYRDIDCLISFGYDIVKNSSRNGGGFYMAEGDFSVAELELLVDAISSSNFISSRKASVLIRKLLSRTSDKRSKLLQRDIVSANRVKTDKDTERIVMNDILEAIRDNKKISFDILENTVDKQINVKESDVFANPFTILMKDGYFSLAYIKDDKLLFIPLRKISHINISNDDRDDLSKFSKKDIDRLSSGNFSVFEGEKETVTLRFPNSFADLVIDKLGKDIDLRPVGKEFFRVRCNVPVGPELFSFLVSIGKDAEVVAPDSVRSKYTKWLSDIMENNSINI